MKYLALLRGVMPTGKNRIPKMSDLVAYLEEAGLQEVSSYIQSGNILFESDLPVPVLQDLIHDTILTKIGADLSIIIKTLPDLELAVHQEPFGPTVDSSRIHLVFTNDLISKDSLKILQDMDFVDERFQAGEACLYIYLPRDAQKKKLNTNFLEKKLGICATMRKLSVIQTLQDRMNKEIGR